MKRSLSLRHVLLPVTLVVWVAGCASSPPARFYTLYPLGPHDATASTPAAAEQVSVGIAPVEIPDYLDRPQIVTRDGSNGLKLAEFDRWAGSLSENIGGVLAQNLALLVGTERVFVAPAVPAGKPEILVVTRVLRLDCLPGKQVLLTAQWTVMSGAERKNAVTRTTSFTEQLNDNRCETMVAAVNRTVEQLSRAVAREIMGQQKNRWRVEP